MSITSRLRKNVSSKTLKTNLSKGFFDNISRLAKMVAKGKRNEDETRRWVIDVLKTGFGYSEDQIETELKVLGKRVDIAIMSKDKVILIIECKATNIELKKNAIHQAANYATSLGSEWAAVTNGQHWQLFHVSPTKGKEPEIVDIFDIELLDDDGISKDDIEMLYYMTEKALITGETKTLYHFYNSTAQHRIIEMLMSDPIMNSVCKELQKQYKKDNGIIVDDIPPEYIRELCEIMFENLRVTNE